MVPINLGVFSLRYCSIKRNLTTKGKNTNLCQPSGTKIRHCRLKILGLSIWGRPIEFKTNAGKVPYKHLVNELESKRFRGGMKGNHAHASSSYLKRAPATQREERKDRSEVRLAGRGRARDNSDEGTRGVAFFLSFLLIFGWRMLSDQPTLPGGQVAGTSVQLQRQATPAPKIYLRKLQTDTWNQRELSDL